MVLLPDPALPTGNGHDFVQRGWGRWGTRARPTTSGDHRRRGEGHDDVDGAHRTAAMGVIWRVHGES